MENKSYQEKSFRYRKIAFGTNNCARQAQRKSHDEQNGGQAEVSGDIDCRFDQEAKKRRISNFPRKKLFDNVS